MATKSKLDIVTEERDAALESVEQFKREHAVLAARAADAKQQRDAALVTVGTLKELLHASEVESARLRGYLGRVHESDDASSQMVTVPQSTVAIPASKLAREGVPYSGGGYMGRSYDSDDKQKHWTSL